MARYVATTSTQSWRIHTETLCLRDPPSLISSSELRDLSLQPSSIRSGRVTIIHPQLRDLILPLERAKVLYPRGTTIEQVSWDPVDNDERNSKSTVGLQFLQGPSLIRSSTT